jgi:putative solute:sodium symporter small subunit
MKKTSLSEYWRQATKITISLLCIWFVASYGCGILFVETLNQIQLFGFPLGFWFSQQGSIFIFIGLILAYCILMDRLDNRVKNEKEST